MGTRLLAQSLAALLGAPQQDKARRAAGQQHALIQRLKQPLSGRGILGVVTAAAVGGASIASL